MLEDDGHATEKTVVVDFEALAAAHRLARRGRGPAAIEEPPVPTKAGRPRRAGVRVLLVGLACVGALAGGYAGAIGVQARFDSFREAAVPRAANSRHDTGTTRAAAAGMAAGWAPGMRAGAPSEAVADAGSVAIGPAEPGDERRAGSVEMPGDDASGHHGAAPARAPRRARAQPKRAARAFALGDYRTALVRYRALARAQPQVEAYRLMIKVLERGDMRVGEGLGNAIRD